MKRPQWDRELKVEKSTKKLDPRSSTFSSNLFYSVNITVNSFTVTLNSVTANF